jgi:hypothetical protein
LERQNAIKRQTVYHLDLSCVPNSCMLWPYRTQDKSVARMLTSTQIENATTEELERLRVRIEAELEGRRGAKERDHESAVEVLKSHETSAGTFQWHGPYLYRFYYRDSKRHSEYISLKKARALGLERPPVPR